MGKGAGDRIRVCWFQTLLKKKVLGRLEGLDRRPTEVPGRSQAVRGRQGSQAISRRVPGGTKPPKAHFAF